jgi:formylglycine-generating enzyme required for sulfatase activity
MKHMWPLVKIQAVIVLLGFFSEVGMLLLGSQSVMAQDLDALKAGVVKIRTKTEQVGTGFIVRLEPETAFIITSAHVIAGDQQPTVEFYSKNLVSDGQAPVLGSVLPGAQVNDDLRGLALVIVRGKGHISNGTRALAFEISTHLVSGDEEAVIIGHPGGGGDWAVVNRDISNRVVHDITLDPGVASQFSGGPIVVNSKVVGIVMSNRGEFGLGITHKSLLNYLEGFGIEPKVAFERSDERLQADARKPETKTSNIIPQPITGKDEPPMVVIQPGLFQMGDWKGSGYENERPVHKVKLYRAFSMGKYEVPFAEYDTFAQATGRKLPNDHGWGRGQLPVINVSWEDAKAYAQWLSDQTGKRYRLPTEAEWEYAARSGGKDESWAGTSDERQLGTYAVYGVTGAAPVGSKQPNGLGLFDMSGNVWEWVEDCWHENYRKAPKDGSPWGKGEGGDCLFRVVRGGSWNFIPEGLRTSSRGRETRDNEDDLVGFRLVQDIP